MRCGALGKDAVQRRQEAPAAVLIGKCELASALGNQAADPLGGDARIATRGLRQARD